MTKMLTVLFGALVVAGQPGSVLGADMRGPLKAPPVLPPVFTWSGFYVGVNGGGAFGSGQSLQITETILGAPNILGTWPGVGDFGSLELTGGFGGGQIGYNWQIGHFVLGIETDLQGANIRDSAAATLGYVAVPNTVSAGATHKVDWFGSFRGRLGFAFDRTLLYATGGVAYGNDRISLNFADTFGFVATATNESVRVGYTVGAGIEWAFASSWSLKAEYQYIDLGTRSVGVAETTITGAPTPLAISARIGTDFHTGRLGINYRF